MEHQGIAHRETQRRLPYPLDSSGIWNPGTWGLPVSVLSIASMFVMAVVLIFPVVGEQSRALFRLPFHPSWANVAAALLAWGLLVLCSSRPGRSLPRFWLLALVVLTSLMSLVSLADLLPSVDLIDSALFHSATLAGLASVLSLLPRGIRLRPDSVMVQWIASLSLLGVLGVILPASYAVGGWSIRAQADRVETMIRELKDLTAAVRDASSYDWSHLSEGADAVQAKVATLATLRVPTGYGGKSIWRVAEVLGRDADLQQAAQELAAALVGGFDPEVTPKLSSLSQPAIWWNHPAKQWQENTLFPGISASVGGYHRELGRLFAELEVADASSKSTALAAVDEHYQAKREELKAYLRTALDAWTDHWAVFLVPEHGDLLGRERISSASLLRMPMAPGEEIPSPANLWGLLDLPLTRARELASEIPGCHPREYPEETNRYFRLDCYAYSPPPEGTGAELRLDMRLVYQWPEKSKPTSPMLPVEAFYLFPMSAEASQNEFQEDVMNGLHEALQDFWNGSVEGLGREGAVTNGFVLRNGKRQLRVVAKIEDYYGQKNALVVRALLRDN